MRYVVPVALLITALIHALPLLGLTGGARLANLYGIADMDASLEILLRHRAVLFGLLAAFLVYAAFNRDLHGIALVGASISVAAFLALAITTGGYNQAVATVVKVDLLAAVALAAGWYAHLTRAGVP
ncbi:MAG: phosphopantetheine adenylyltransferase [Gammaproteobacteria bacterium]|nr:phosphopantetheine adenylyltransferase [Gammaproteobacteria bacterium]